MKQEKHWGSVVVTGASSGIGRACALLLARTGFQVFGGVRKDSDARSLQDESEGHLTPLLLDVTDPDIIAESVAIVAEAVGGAGLAGLVNNAGVGIAWPLEYVPLDTFRRQFEVCVFGHLAVTQAFLPLIRRATGRIVNIGSVGDRITIPFGGPLNASKYALASVNDALRMELSPWGLHVCLIEPGSIRTRAGDELESKMDPTVAQFSPTGRSRYADAYRAMVVHASAQERAGSSPEVVARTVRQALTASRPKTRYLVGATAHPLAALAKVLPDRLLDQVRLRFLGMPHTFGVRQTENHD